MIVLSRLNYNREQEQAYLAQELSETCLSKKEGSESTGVNTPD